MPHIEILSEDCSVNILHNELNNELHSESSGYQRKVGIKYCTSCGKECNIDDVLCTVCKNETFVPTKISEIIGGYIEITKCGNCDLRKYYSKIMGIKSSIKINNKRIIEQLLFHKSSIHNINKELIDKIYNANINKEK